MTYNLKNESYSIFVRSTTSIDTHFLLEYSDEEIWDDYEHSVFSDQNTLDRFVDEYKNSFLSLVQEKNEDVTYISVLPKEHAKHYLEFDSEFDQMKV